MKSKEFELSDENTNIINKDVNYNNEYTYKRKIVWRNVISLSLLHILAIYGYTTGFDPQYPWYSFLCVDLFGRIGGLGVLAGSHRLWSHRSYKAKLPLRILLMIMQTMALQNDIYEWCRDHRTHHKFSETDADPHNSRRGFFFAHIGWLLVRKHPEVIRKGKTIDMNDVWADPVVRFQRRFYIPLVIIFWGLVPTYVSHKMLGISIWQCFLGAVIVRYVLSLQYSWLVNSAAHLYGHKIYDVGIEPRENRYVTYFSMGEGYHNYHHLYPNDYSASEMGWRFNYNPATAFIDFFAYIGWAYDLKKPDQSVVRARIDRTGDELLYNKLLNKFNTIVDMLLGFLFSYSIFWFTLVLRFLIIGHI